MGIRKKPGSLIWGWVIYFSFFLSFSAEARVYFSREEALKLLLPGAQEFKEEQISLTQAQLERAWGLLGTRFRKSDYSFYRGLKDGIILGYGLVLNVRGKERPITFLIIIGPEGRIEDLEVLVFRESQGSEIRNPRFKRQFKGKDLYQIEQDITAVTGATLSSRAAVYAAKKALAIFKVVFLPGLRRPHK